MQEGSEDEAIAALPGQTRWSLDGLLGEVQQATAVGVRAVVLFPKIDDAAKSSKVPRLGIPMG